MTNQSNSLIVAGRDETNDKIRRIRSKDDDDEAQDEGERPKLAGSSASKGTKVAALRGIKQPPEACNGTEGFG
jgi:hypothetical protein